MFKLLTLLTHSYFYLPLRYKLKNLSVLDNKIIDNENNIIYCLNNIPKNNRDYNLYSYFIDSVYNNSYDNHDYPEPFTGDLSDCNNYRIMIHINNSVFQKIINNNHQIPSESVFFRLLENNNSFSPKIYDPINIKNICINSYEDVDLDLLESRLNNHNTFTNNIFKNHNLIFYSLINKYSCHFIDKSNYIKINGGIISKNIDYQHLLINNRQHTLIITDDIQQWESLITKQLPDKKLFFQISKVNETYYIRNHHNNNLNTAYNIFDIYWDRVIIDVNSNSLETMNKDLKRIRSCFKWFLFLNKNKTLISKIIIEYLIDCKNLKYPFLKLISKNITNNFNGGFQSIKNIVLDFSKYDKERYREHSKRIDDFNQIYLKKLCCYPDIFFNFDKLFPKTNTIHQYMKIADNFFNANENIQHSFIKNQIQHFKSKDHKCPVCFEKVTQEDFGITICGHIFCFSCLKESLSYKSQCPKCRFSIYNNTYKITEKSTNLKLIDYNSNNLVDLIGTKLTFLIYLLNLKISKNEKILVCSKYYCFLEKIKSTLDIFNINNKLLLDNNTYFNRVITKSVFLGHSKILLKKDYKILNIQKILFVDPLPTNHIFKIISNVSDISIPVTQIIINNTVECGY